MRHTIKEKIAAHVCYRDVFNAPVSLASLSLWLSEEDHHQSQIERAISSLIEEGFISKRDGYLVCAGKEGIIKEQKEKTALANRLMAKGEKGLSLLSKIPLIRFIGVSGSVAADNPTKESKDENVDLDLFIITSKNCLWLFVFFERIYTNLIKRIRGNYFYCFNYVTDEDFLEIYNKNFFTATELVNLKVIKDKGVYRNLIQNNRWIADFYSDRCLASGYKPSEPGRRYTSWSASLLNYFFYGLFGLTRSLKRLDLKGLRDLSSSFDPNQRFNLKRISNSNGGYQELIKERFNDLMVLNFSDYYSADLIEEYFPKEDSFHFSPSSQREDLEFEQLFEKYKVYHNEKSTV